MVVNERVIWDFVSPSELSPKPGYLEPGQSRGDDRSARISRLRQAAASATRGIRGGRGSLKFAGEYPQDIVYKGSLKRNARSERYGTYVVPAVRAVSATKVG